MASACRGFLPLTPRAMPVAAVARRRVRWRRRVTMIVTRLMTIPIGPNVIDGLRCERYWADRTVAGGVTTQPPVVSLVLQIPHDAGLDAVSFTVDAVLAQSRGDFELIVVDDG